VKISRKKYTITYLFLVLFLSMKITGMHALLHSDHNKELIIHCTVCENAIAHNLTPSLTPNLEEYSINNVELQVQSEVINNYNFISSSVIASNQLFSRPPPFLL